MTVGVFVMAGGKNRYKPLAVKFWSKVKKAGLDECWTWTGKLDTNGYGQIIYLDPTGTRRQAGVHRLSYEMHVDTPPKGFSVRHTCDNSVCVNPRHLILGTHQENMTDRAVRERGGNNILTADAVRDMRSRHAAGEKIRDLAVANGVHYITALDAISRRTWKHVP